MLDRMNTRLKGWKTTFLTFASASTLIQNTLATIPTNSMQIHLLPAKTRSHNDRIQRNFLWVQRLGLELVTSLDSLGISNLS